MQPDDLRLAAIEVILKNFRFGAEDDMVRTLEQTSYLTKLADYSGEEIMTAWEEWQGDKGNHRKGGGLRKPSAHDLRRLCYRSRNPIRPHRPAAPLIEDQRKVVEDHDRARIMLHAYRADGPLAYCLLQTWETVKHHLTDEEQAEVAFLDERDLTNGLKPSKAA